MYFNHHFMPNHPDMNRSYQTNPYYYGGYSYPDERQQTIRGQATWTEGGQVTQCGIPWSDNAYMTAAVGENSPYQCGQTIKVINLSRPVPTEVFVTVVDQVPGYPANRINLHRRAFEALGSDLNTGVIDIEIDPSPDLEEEQWGKFLMEIIQVTYPNDRVLEYNYAGETEIGPGQTQEAYNFILQSGQGRRRVRGSVTYNPNTDRVISINLQEV